MRILAIESSCDEFAAAIVEDGRFVLSEVVNSQIDIHKLYGGVVPEVAARSHLEVALAVVDECMKGLAWDDIDAIAVTARPGLIGSLMIGTLVARTLAMLEKKPLYAVDHIEGHVYAAFLESEAGCSDSSKVPCAPPCRLSSCLFRSHRTASQATHTACDFIDLLSRHSSTTTRKDISYVGYGSDSSRDESAASALIPKFPFLALVVSGGHTQIMLFRSHSDYEIIGRTRDDAVGEAFDKVAKILGLPYPGGPSIAEAAERGNVKAYKLPKPKVDGFNFSFSGLKTAVLRAVQRKVGVDHTFPSSSLSARLNASARDDFAAVFQKTAVEILVEKVTAAAEEYRAKSVVLAGGVAANQELRKALEVAFTSVDRLSQTSSRVDRSALPVSLADCSDHSPQGRSSIPSSWAPRYSSRRPRDIPEPHDLSASAGGVGFQCHGSLFIPPMKWCTDNAAMIGARAYFLAKENPPVDPRDLGIYPTR